MEHRCAPRRVLDLSVLVNTPDGTVRNALMKDVSKTGARLALAAGPPLQSNVVEVTLISVDPSHERDNVRARAFVVRVQDNEVGVLWTEPNVLARFPEIQTGTAPDRRSAGARKPGRAVAAGQ